MTTDTGDGADDSPCCKIGRGIQKYDRDRLNDRLTKQYTIDDASLRDLEQTVNESFVRAVLDDIDDRSLRRLNDAASTTPGELVEILTGDNRSGSGSGSERARTETILNQAGVDTDELVSDFVSYRTVKTHLNQCLNIDTSRQAPDRVTRTDAQDTVEWAVTRCERVIERTIERLEKTNDGIPETDVTATASTRVTCSDCGSTKPVTAYITNGCDCTS